MNGQSATHSLCIWTESRDNLGKRVAVLNTAIQLVRLQLRTKPACNILLHVIHVEGGAVGDGGCSCSMFYDLVPCAVLCCVSCSMRLLQNTSRGIGDLILIYKRMTGLAGHTSRVAELLEQVDGGGATLVVFGAMMVFI